jgi:glycosyltransferase involved in cell wall biosynthesis
MPSAHKISVLLPTRGRTEMLKTSLYSLVDNADDASSIELLLAFDDDDTASLEWFEEHIAPHLDEKGTAYTAYSLPRLGYTRLNEYVNLLAKHAEGDWLFFWGDDGIIHTQGWDSQITQVKDFRLLRIPAHNSHPYAIWPIVPREWFELCNHLSPHPLIDAWISQISYIIDIVQNLDIDATHDRFDLTGNNKDSTFKERVYFEGNPSDARDFNHKNNRILRWNDALKIADHLRKQGHDMSWFDNVVNLKQDPWAKMTSPEYDPNRQVARLS